MHMFNGVSCVFSHATFLALCATINRLQYMKHPIRPRTVNLRSENMPSLPISCQDAKICPPLKSKSLSKRDKERGKEYLEEERKQG